MTVSLANRVGRIISGGINMLVDAVEDAAPEAVMEQAVREIDGAMEEVRTELGRTIAAKHLANTRLQEENAKHEELAGQIELAVSEGRDELAETAIAQQLDIEARIPVLERTITQGSETERELEGYLAALHAKKREMEEELRAFRASQRQAAQPGEDGQPAAGVGGAGNTGIDRRVRAASSVFDRVSERASGVPAGTRAEGMNAASQLAELNDLARQNRVRERLAAIKARSAGEGA